MATGASRVAHGEGRFRPFGDELAGKGAGAFGNIGRHDGAGARAKERRGHARLVAPIGGVLIGAAAPRPGSRAGATVRAVRSILASEAAGASVAGRPGQPGGRPTGRGATLSGTRRTAPATISGGATTDGAKPRRSSGFSGVYISARDVRVTGVVY